jgi:hypothetical protein
MALDSTAIKAAIGKIIGDNGGLWDAELDLELSNTLIELTTENVMYWNTVELGPLSHTNGRIDLPENTGKILAIIDTEDPKNVYIPATGEYYFYNKYASDIFNVYGDPEITKQIPFQVKRDSLGVEYIEISPGSNIPPTRQFYILATLEIAELTPLVPDKLRSYIVSKTAWIMLGYIDSPDIELQALHEKIWNRSLRLCLDAGVNKSLSRLNNPIISPGLTITNKRIGGV